METALSLARACVCCLMLLSNSETMLKKLLDFFAPKSDVYTSAGDDALSNKVLLAELRDHFKSELDKLSVGDRMLYPMSFKILLHHEDYDNVKESFPFVLPEVVKEFYKVIRTMSKTYSDFTPPAKDWVFQFSPCRVEDVNLSDGKVVIVKKGHITTVASLMAVDLRQKNVSVSANTRVSIKLQDAGVMNDVNVNWDAISRIDIISENYFRCKFDPALSPSSVRFEHDSSSASGGALAVLSYERSGATTSFTIYDYLVEVSGPAGVKGSPKVFCIQDCGLAAPHVQIKYIPESKKFQVAAYAKTRVSSRELEISQPGMPKWYPLANNSKLLVNDEICLRFEVK